MSWKSKIPQNVLHLLRSTPGYRLVYMIIDVAHHILFGPPRIIDECELKKPCKFLHLEFDNKGIDAVNVNNILNHKKSAVLYSALL